MESAIAFIYTHISIKDYEPVEILKGHTFRKASNSEIEVIKDNINQTSIGSHFHKAGVAYDSVIHEEKYSHKTNFHRKKLPENEWKYWVIAYNGTNYNFENIKYSLSLLKNSLDIGFHIFYTEENQKGDVAGSALSAQYLLKNLDNISESYKNAVEVEISEIKEISTIFKKVEKNIEAYAFIKHAVNNFEDLKNIPYNSNLLLVGYFSIIESLVTHPPRLNESLDSISHQLRKKLNLLFKRFVRKIYYSSYFLEAKEDKIWSKLYSYRSSIAHGNAVNFNSEFQILVSNEKITEFLTEVIKNLILLSLEEPEFIEDLKLC